VRYLNAGLGLALLIAPFMLGAPEAATISSAACGVLLVALSFRRGAVRQHYAGWDRLIV
jgi:hypothetical protein